MSGWFFPVCVPDKEGMPACTIPMVMKEHHRILGIITPKPLS